MEAANVAHPESGFPHTTASFLHCMHALQHHSRKCTGSVAGKHGHDITATGHLDKLFIEDASITSGRSNGHTRNGHGRPLWLDRPQPRTGIRLVVPRSRLERSTVAGMRVNTSPRSFPGKRGLLSKEVPKRLDGEIDASDSLVRLKRSAS